MTSPSATPKLTKVYRLDSIPLGKAVYTEEEAAAAEAQDIEEIAEAAE